MVYKRGCGKYVGKGSVKNNFREEVVLKKYLNDGMEFHLKILVLGEELWNDSLEFQEEGATNNECKNVKCET